MPRVSVILPTYNYGRFVGEAIQSVLGQTFQDFELIVVDDGSTDNTRDVVGSFTDPRLRYIYKENGGESSAYNVGIHASSGEYIAFLDSDDIWLPRKLELQVKAMESAPQAGLVYSDVLYFDSTTGAIIEQFSRKLHGPLPRGMVLERHIEEFFAHPSTWLVRRMVFDRVGMFDEGQMNSEDEDMLFRIASCFEFEVVPMPLAMARTHLEQKSRKTDAHMSYFMRYLNKTIQSPILNSRMRASLRRTLALYHFRYGLSLRRRHEYGRAAREFLASFKANPRVFAYKAKSQLGGKLTQIVGKLTRSPVEIYRRLIEGGKNHRHVLNKWGE
jgi:glycosyltransferase involved in cell wall biosynthesis